ncbi:MAG TPA: phosphopantetheine-binding protein [Sideroxyarcus sp.]|nr:phosphopantetheine-binding protein [Sideroxyarcus sp.]
MTDNNAAFRAELKAFILAAVDKAEPEGGLRDDEPWFGPESRLELDSLDALQISMAIQKKYGVRMPDSKETRRALSSLATLAEHLQNEK